VHKGAVWWRRTSLEHHASLRCAHIYLGKQRRHDARRTGLKTAYGRKNQIPPQIFSHGIIFAVREGSSSAFAA